MKEQFRDLLGGIDARLPYYFLVKGGRIRPVPQSQAELKELLASGYERLAFGDNVELSNEVIAALTEILSSLGERSILLFPLAVAAILSHEAGREGSALNRALYGAGARESSSQEGKSQKRKK